MNIHECICIIWYESYHHATVSEHTEAETKWPQLCRRYSKCIFLNGNVLIMIRISLKFVAKGLINNVLAFVQRMALRRQANI